MKQDIHPKYYTKAKITCACGHVHTIGATKESASVEICSKCHPFYTGKENLVDTAGRVERFEARRAKFSARSKSASGGKAKQERVVAKAKDKKSAIKKVVTKHAVKKTAKSGKTATGKEAIKKKVPAKKK